MLTLWLALALGVVCFCAGWSLRGIDKEKVRARVVPDHMILKKLDDLEPKSVYETKLLKIIRDLHFRICALEDRTRAIGEIQVSVRELQVEVRRLLRHLEA